MSRRMDGTENRSPEQKFQEIIHRERPPYYKLLGIHILDVKLGYAKLKMDWSVHLSNPYGFVNGGFFSVLADAALACALLGMTQETPTRRLVTIGYNMNIVRSVREGDITADAKVLHLKDGIAVGIVELRDDNEEMVALGDITYSVRL